MSDDNVYDWKYRIDHLERRKLTEGAVSMSTTARLLGIPWHRFDVANNNIDPSHSETDFKHLYMQEIPDENR